jgi:hypothetical protein
MSVNEVSDESQRIVFHDHVRRRPEQQIGGIEEAVALDTAAERGHRDVRGHKIVAPEIVDLRLGPLGARVLLREQLRQP